jgi:hypothetical protein
VQKDFLVPLDSSKIKFQLVFWGALASLAKSLFKAQQNYQTQLEALSNKFALEFSIFNLIFSKEKNGVDNL